MSTETLALHIFVNNQAVTLPHTSSLQDFLHAYNKSNQGPYSVALNGEFVPRGQYSNTPLHSGDQLDIVSPVGGG